MHSSYNDDVATSAFPAMGTGLPFLDVSSEGTPDHGKSRPTRTLKRDPFGRFAGKPLPHREAVEVGPPTGVHSVAPGRQYSVAHDRNQGNEQFINHVLGCRSCAVGGFVRLRNV